MSRDAFDKVFDVILNDAAKEVDRKLGNELEEYEGTINYSKRHNKKMKKLFKAERRKESKRQTIKTILICALVVFIIFVSLFAFCEPFRVNVLNTYLELKENINFNFSFNDNSSASYKDEYIELGYVPNGFELNKTAYKNNEKFYKFKNSNRYFQLAITRENLKLSVDSENSNIQPININNKKELFFSNDNDNIKSIIFSVNNYYIRLSSNTSKTELIKIAENLNILK